MPRRHAITISLDDDTLALVDQAKPLHGGNRSAVIKGFVHGYIRAGSPQVSAPPPAETAGHTITISAAGWAALERIAADAGKTTDDVARLALRYATQYPTRWL